ncbi:MAG TPA: hypothetical protein VJS86_13695 [Arthrobacter sp.]|nr:hypothetical protein [Arthrobacter sp.]
MDQRVVTDGRKRDTKAPRRVETMDGRTGDGDGVGVLAVVAGRLTSGTGGGAVQADGATAVSPAAIPVSCSMRRRGKRGPGTGVWSIS